MLGDIVLIGTPVLKFVLDVDKLDKDCTIEEGCDYFDNIVTPGINKNDIH